MTRIFLDPEGALDVARKMRELAQRQSQMVQHFQSHLLRLSDVWKGQAPEQYIEEQMERLRLLHNRITQIEDLAIELKRKVDQYLEIDSYFGES